jgi:hypothetical protein
MLLFEVVNFSEPYHVIMEWPCYDKFMAILSYAYLKLKIPEPIGVINVTPRVSNPHDYVDYVFKRP